MTTLLPGTDVRRLYHRIEISTGLRFYFYFSTEIPRQRVTIFPSKFSISNPSDTLYITSLQEPSPTAVRRIQNVIVNRVRNSIQPERFNVVLKLAMASGKHIAFFFFYFKP
jgi:hypothetical protein